MRRTALLIAAPVLAGGLLAACDLPGGTPTRLAPDQVPNNEPPGATIQSPAIVNGSLDPNDQVDFFTLAAPATDNPQELQITCSPGVAVYSNVGISTEQIGSSVECDGTPQLLGGVDGSVTIEVTYPEESSNQAFRPYVLNARYVPADTGTIITG